MLNYALRARVSMVGHSHGRGHLIWIDARACAYARSSLVYKQSITLAVTEGLVREEQLLHDLGLLGAVTVDIIQILPRVAVI